MVSLAPSVYGFPLPCIGVSAWRSSVQENGCPASSTSLVRYPGLHDPDQFCRQTLTQHGPIFQTSVFGGTTVFVGDPAAIQMTFNGDGSYTEIGLPATTMAMFWECSLFQRPDLHRQRKAVLFPGFTGTMLASSLPQMHRVIRQHLQT